MYTKQDIMLALTLSFLATALLIGLRFDAAWAGGEGYKPQAIFEAVDFSEPMTGDPIRVSRGDVLQTGTWMMHIATDDYAYPCAIWLDQNTIVTIANAQEGETTFSLITGRIVVDCQATISAREASVTFDGAVTAVNYSWLHTMDTAVIDGTATAKLGEQSIDITSSSASMDTIDDNKNITTPTAFNVKSDAVATFYDWAVTDVSQP